MTISRCICGHPDGMHVNLRGRCRSGYVVQGWDECECESFLVDTPENRAREESFTDQEAEALLIEAAKLNHPAGHYDTGHERSAPPPGPERSS